MNCWNLSSCDPRNQIGLHVLNDNRRTKSIACARVGYDFYAFVRNDKTQRPPSDFPALVQEGYVLPALARRQAY